MRTPRQALGRAGESLAERYLARQGFEILERNFRCRLGEIDLIASHQGVLVFVEVKTRRDSPGSPLEAVDTRKQRRMMRTAAFYLSRRGLHETAARFDVVGISMGDGTPGIEHITNAFDFQETY